jgi:hypothetical protein
VGLWEEDSPHFLLLLFVTHSHSSSSDTQQQQEDESNIGSAGTLIHTQNPSGVIKAKRTTATNGDGQN